MEPERARLVREIFEAALEVAPETRRAYVEDACGGDHALLQNVSDLLEAHADPDSALLLPTDPLPRSDRQTPVQGFQTGDLLGERFEIVRLLGRGGMGQVYEAKDQTLHRSVALKMLPTEHVNDPRFRQWLRREARALAALKHSNICAVHDVDRFDGQDVLVIEYLEGETLASKSRYTQKVGLPEAVQIGIEICKALDYAHNRGVVHRDLKPANIMLTPDGVKLLDFGIARFTAVESGDLGHGSGTEAHATLAATITGHGGVVGTLHYMSPEQASGEPLDGRSDLFSLGVVLYEMATGTHPFHGESPSEVLHAILHEPPTLPQQFNREIPTALEHAILRCLEKHRHLRFKSAAELQRALEAVQSDPAFNSADSERVLFTPNNQRTKVWAAVAAATLLVAIPLYRAYDLRSSISLAIRRDAAIREARRSAATLMYPTEHLRDRATFNVVVDLNAVGSVAGAQGMQRLVQSGKALAWDIDFTRNGSRRSAPDTDAGVSLRLDCAGRLLEFQRAGVPLRQTPPDLQIIKSRSIGVVSSSFQLLGPSNARVDTGLFNGAVPTGVEGWDEQIRVQWSRDTDFTHGGGKPLVPGELLLLSRHIVPKPGVLSSSRDEWRVARPILNAHSALSRQFPLVLYAVGIWMLFLYRHTLKWLPALVLAAWMAVAGMLVPYARPDTIPPHVPPALASFTFGFIAWVLSVLAFAGLYAWLRSTHYRAMVGFEQLLKGRVYMGAAGASLANGVLAGFVVAGLYILDGTLSGSLLHIPDVVGVVTAIQGDSPWLFRDVIIGFSAPATVFSFVIVFHAMRPIVRNEWAAIATASIWNAILNSDPSSSSVLISFPLGVLVVVCYLLVYRTVGLAGAVLAYVTGRFTIAGIIGLHLGNASFAQESMPLIEIPIMLALVGIMAGPVVRSRVGRYATTGTLTG